jgi:hypothetical protein
MKDSILKARIVPKTAWTEFLVGSGPPSWETKKDIF